MHFNFGLTVPKAEVFSLKTLVSLDTRSVSFSKCDKFLSYCFMKGLETSQHTVCFLTALLWAAVLNSKQLNKTFQQFQHFSKFEKPIFIAFGSKSRSIVTLQFLAKINVVLTDEITSGVMSFQISPHQLSVHVTHPMTSPADEGKAMCYTHSSLKCLPQPLCLWSMETPMK